MSLALLSAMLLAAGEKAGPLTLDTIRDVVHEHRAEVRACYDGSASGKAKTAGKLTAHFVISEQGTVSEASIRDATLDDKGLEACLVGAVKGWKFPKPKHGPAAINFPFHFGPPPAKFVPPPPEPVE
ncbi:MAG: AgmX/PglI C-terminal domain-containing protein [Archangiaceae bacterium]|nr:AgmX/PglI C-terminal domain-containing protein [Archangiaceae bacterium]